ncbi:MAG: dihydroxy-acid dehydratase [Planctomycetaceae bacterium]|nr:dihydroxy-acid dehydratase [Planctomycetaceae bacterium]
MLQNGDTIEIDIPGRTLHVKLSDAELQERKKSWKPLEPRIKTGYLAKYITLATSADTGAVLKW